jgi:histidinol-phosphate/aromatic aminotransferase/cobyric acid decarboxylase-like protein
MYPPHFLLQNAIRPNIFALQAYVTSTSDESGPRAWIQLDANENSLGNPFSQQSISKGGQSYFDSRSLIATRQARLFSLPQAPENAAGLASLNEQSAVLYSLKSPMRTSIDKATPDTWTPSTDGSRDRLSDLSHGDVPSSISSSSNTGVLAGDDDMLASLHRYPSAAQFELKRKIADWKGVRGMRHPRWAC